MNNPQENISYRANLLLTVSFDDIEFVSNIKNYEFEVSGDYDYGEEGLENMAKRYFIEEHESVFIDVDLGVVVTSIKKF